MSMHKPPASEQRIAFETWYKANDTSANLVRTGKGYIDNTTRVAWRVWQAAPAAPVQEPVSLANEVIGCFNAAMVEGLQEALAETTDERLKDLVERRLMYALYAAQDTTPPAAQPPRFPTMLRKMWSGTEVQEWIDANWKGGAA
jgi:hypothetical protein